MNIKWKFTTYDCSVKPITLNKYITISTIECVLHAKLRNRTCQVLDRQGQGQGLDLHHWKYHRDKIRLRSTTSTSWWMRSWSTCVRYSRPAGTPGIVAGIGIHCTTGWPGWTTAAHPRHTTVPVCLRIRVKCFTEKVVRNNSDWTHPPKKKKILTKPYTEPQP